MHPRAFTNITRFWLVAVSPLCRATLRRRVRFKPQCAGRGAWIDAGYIPPFGFVAGAMDLSMVPPAKRDRELITNLAAECPGLCKAEVMGIRW